jgi:hypothetical protein
LAARAAPAAVSVGDLLARIAARLDAAGIPYMVAGSFASTFHGVPRSTHDIDVIIDPTGASLAALLTTLPETDYYVDGDAANDALRRRATFNVIDLATGWKIDLIIRKARPFSIEELARRQSGELYGAVVSIATAEDAIIAKLEWAKLSDSERQLRDVEGVLAVRAANLDVSYIERWVAELGLETQWARVRGARP